MPFNWFDVFLVIILAMSVFAGFRAGLARVVVGLVAVTVGLLAAFWSYGIAAAKLVSWGATPGVANIGGFFLVFFGVLLLGSLIGSLLSYLLKWVGLSWLNHAMGGAAGLLRGVLFVGILVDAVIAFSPSPPPQFLNNSRLLPYATPVAGWLATVAPRELQDAFDAQAQTLRRLWKPARERALHEI